MLVLIFKLDHFHDVIYIGIPSSSYMETTWSGLSAKKEPCCGPVSKKASPPEPLQS